MRHSTLARTDLLNFRHTSVGTISDLIRADVFEWGKIMAGSLMVAAPPVIIYAFLMVYYIAGLTAGATKG